MWRRATNTSAPDVEARECLRKNYLEPLQLIEVEMRFGDPCVGSSSYVVEENEIGLPQTGKYPLAGIYIPLEIYVQYIMAVNSGMSRTNAERLARG